ncbi:50S ribosomal protein L6 [Agaribacterium sp. ZY112]|uniref:50S ribosomal protein L6 n=1 Tax=Agaribacterium sp. ZY112 TaxID=3233574 RepID=UPI0035263FD4
MSRIANAPVELPSAVKIDLKGQDLQVSGKNGKLSLVVHDKVTVQQEENVLKFAASENSKEAKALAGTMRALVNNMVSGVDKGFEKKLILNGVGYRAKASGKTINLALGLSHPVDYSLPEGVTAETPSQTEIVLKSADKQLLGQAAAEIRAFRPPEPYKGKGIRYGDEHVRRKEAKKK